MRLGKYLEINNISLDEFVARLGGSSSRRSVQRWATGESTPSLEYLVQIEKLTKGAVTASDFQKGSPAT
jgi:transcriptional regulator with XRE-family HTH domain